MLIAWKSDVYHLLPMSHVSREVKVIFSVLVCLQPDFVKLFRCFHNIAKAAIIFVVCPSVHPQDTTRLPLDGIS